MKKLTDRWRVHEIDEALASVSLIGPADAQSGPRHTTPSFIVLHLTVCNKRINRLKRQALVKIKYCPCMGHACAMFRESRKNYV